MAMTIEVADPRLLALIDESARPELLATGFGFVEGPIWNPREGCLYFSDIIGDARIRWSEGDGANLARSPNSKGNGMTYDANLALITCEHSTSRVTRNDGDNDEVLASHF